MSHFAALSVLTAASLNTLEARIAALEASVVTLAATDVTLAATDAAAAALLAAMKLPLQAAQHGETSTQVSESAGTLTDTGLTVSITTTVVNSKVLVEFNQWLGFPSGDPLDLILLRGATTIETILNGATTPHSSQPINAAGTAVDVPGAIAAYTYKLQFRRTSGSGTATAQPGSDFRSSIRVTEVRP